MRHKAEKMGRNRGQGIIIGFLVFVIAVISICTIIFRSYVREFHNDHGGSEAGLLAVGIPRSL